MCLNTCLKAWSKAIQSWTMCCCSSKEFQSYRWFSQKNCYIYLYTSLVAERCFKTFRVSKSVAWDDILGKALICLVSSQNVWTYLLTYLLSYLELGSIACLIAELTFKTKKKDLRYYHNVKWNFTITVVLSSMSCKFNTKDTIYSSQHVDPWLAQRYTCLSVWQ